jgi:hypothetical protein
MAKKCVFLAFASTTSNVKQCACSITFKLIQLLDKGGGWKLYIHYEGHTCHYMFGCPKRQPLQILNLVNPLHSSWKGSITQHTCPVAFGVLDFPCTMVDPCHLIRNGIHQNITKLQTLEFPH